MDELDRMEAALLRRARRRKIILGMIGLAALLSVILPCVYVTFRIGSGISESRERRAEYEAENGQVANDAQRLAVEHALTTAEQRLPQRNERWHEVLARSKDSVGDPSVPCPQRLPLRPPSEAQRHGSFNNLDDFDVYAFIGRQSFPWAVVVGGLPETAPRVAEARSQIGSIREAISRPGSLDAHARTVENAEALGSSYWSYDVLIVPDFYRRPIATAIGDSFSPGELVGRALVYDYRQERVVCSVAVRASTTSDHVDYTTQQFQGGSTLQGMLSAEMDAQIERAVSLALRSGGALAQEQSESSSPAP